jgi:hypothetical protein
LPTKVCSNRDALLGAVLAALLLAACADVPAPTPTAAPTASLAPSTANPTPDYWADLAARPLQLPYVSGGEPCPRTQAAVIDDDYAPLLGASPIYLLSPGSGLSTWYTTWGDPEDGRYQLIESQWLNDPSYLGPAVLRGAAIDGSGNTLEFEDEADPRGDRAVPLVRFPTDPRDLGAEHADMRRYQVSTWVSGAGCYAYQVDGIGFSETIVVELEIRPPDANGN